MCHGNGVEKKLKELQINLPEAAAPAANYLPYCISNSKVYVSGQLPKDIDGELFLGKLGDGSKSVEDGAKAAELCSINILAQLKAALGNLERVKRIVKITVFVNCTPDFTLQHLVANGASDLLVKVFGEEVGRHARCAVGVSSLPLGALVEVDAIAEFLPE